MAINRGRGGRGNELDAGNKESGELGSLCSKGMAGAGKEQDSSWWCRDMMTSWCTDAAYRHI